MLLSNGVEVSGRHHGDYISKGTEGGVCDIVCGCVCICGGWRCTRGEADRVYSMNVTLQSYITGDVEDGGGCRLQYGR